MVLLFGSERWFSAGKKWLPRKKWLETGCAPGQDKTETLKRSQNGCLKVNCIFIYFQIQEKKKLLKLLFAVFNETHLQSRVTRLREFSPMDRGHHLIANV
jgi:hypothetical protein